VVLLPKKLEEDELMLVVLDAGAEDLVDDGDTWRVVSEPTNLHAVRTALEESDIAFDSADLTMQATTSVSLDTAEDAKKVLRLIDALDDLDDVQEVYANFDIPDPVMQTLEV
jgi:transcriptional/translational regulatory protein YebC/TACO1